MICKFCGSELPEGSVFCTSCGARADETEAPQEAPVSNAPSKARQIWAAIGKAICYFLVFNLVQIATAFIYSFGISFAVGFSAGMSGIVDPEAITEAINKIYYQYINEMMAVSGILTILTMFIFFRARKKRLTREIKVNKTSLLVLLGALALGVAAQFAINVTISLLSPLLPEWIFTALEDQNGILDNGSMVFQIINVAVITPIVEEMMFRGLIHTRLSRALSRVTAVAVSSVIFGIAHGNVLGFFYAGSLGVVLALVFDRYDSILPAIFIHAGFNGASYILMMFPENTLLILGVYFISIAVMAALLFLMLKKPTPKVIETIRE